MRDSETQNELNLAVLIDADNVPSSYVKEMLEEIARYGTPTIKRIYGDWTTNNVSGWKNCLLKNAITPIQQYSYTYGKNSTDSAMIIDAMDILYTNRVDGFCIVSSDSDFTRLATRLREAGKKVFGIGEKKTPVPFITACDKFIYLEILTPQETESEPENDKTNGKKKAASAGAAKQSSAQKPAAQKPALPEAVVKLILSSADTVADEDGWAFLGEVGNLIIKRQPDFDPRNYGFSKLTKLIAATEKFEIDQRETSNRRVTHIYIRQK